MAIVEVLFLAVFWSWAATALFFIRTTFLARDPIRVDPQSFGLPGETVSFKSTDGVLLQGWKITSGPAQPWIIGCHGLGSNRSDLLEITQFFHKAGFNVLLFDFRGHGGSAGGVTSYGFTEQRDLEGALSFLGSQVDIEPKPYGIYGISMGASVALMTAARDERLAAVVADSPYRDLDSSIAGHLKLMYPALPRQPFLAYIRLAYRLRFGRWPGEISPKEAMAALFRRPVLLIAGGQDLRMPSKEIQAMAHKESKAEFWEIPGAGHLEGFAINPEAYSERVISFFSTHL